MGTSQEITSVDKSDLVGITARLLAEGNRLVQIGCSTLTSGYELTYSFDRDYRLTNLRIIVAPGEEVPSISAIFPSAFLYENEIHDLFGVPVTNIAVDYRGTLYRTVPTSPFSVDNVKLPEPPKPKPPASVKEE